MTKAQFDSIEEGTVIEAGIPLQGLTEEPIIWTCYKRTDKVIRVSGVYLGIEIGLFIIAEASAGSGRFIWVEGK